MDATEAATLSYQTIPRPLPPEDQARADMYALVANLLLHAPDAQLLSVIAEASPLDAEQPENALAQAWNALICATRVASAQEVRDEFDALFVGTGTPLLNPYGSFYLAGFLMEKPLAALRDDLAVLGLRRRQDTGELEDHLGALCEAMCLLITGGPGVPRRTTQEQRTFFTRHIAPWYARCLEDIRSADSARFYRHIADLAEAFLQLDAEAFSMEGDVNDAGTDLRAQPAGRAGRNQHAMERQTR